MWDDFTCGALATVEYLTAATKTGSKEKPVTVSFGGRRDIVEGALRP